MKVCKDVLVMIKRKLANDPYHLQGLIIIDLTSVSFMVDWDNGLLIYSIYG